MTEPSELERALEALEARCGLLRALCDTSGNATEHELWLGCWDTTSVLTDASRLLRELARDFARWTADPIPCLGTSQRKKLDIARERWRLSE